MRKTTERTDAPGSARGARGARGAHARVLRVAGAALAVAVGVICPAVLSAQNARSAGDALRLGELQQRATRHDPRSAKTGMLAEQSALRLRGITREWLPSLSVEAHAQYQSEVAGLPGSLANAMPIPRPPLDSYDAQLVVGQSILDPTRSGRRLVEERRLAASESEVRTVLFALRREVNAAYFTALLAQAQGDEVEAGITALVERLRVTDERVRLGAALPSESMTIEAELVRRRQALSDLAASRAAAIEVLGELVDDQIPSAQRLVIPELADVVASARAALDTIRARPELEQIERNRDLLDAESAVVSAARLPTLSAFARAGYGRPGLNPLASEFSDYWLVGVQMKWAPWDWGARDRQREVLSVQQRQLDADSDALVAQLRRSVVNDISSMDRIVEALAEDDTIVSLQERILAETRLRFDEGVVGSVELVDRERELLSARLARIAHQVRLAQARAGFLTTLGLELR